MWHARLAQHYRHSTGVVAFGRFVQGTADTANATARDELEANESKATPSGGKTAFSIERRAVTVVFD